MTLLFYMIALFIWPMQTLAATLTLLVITAIYTLVTSAKPLYLLYWLGVERAKELKEQKNNNTQQASNQ